jgi:hypothetical protein
MNIGQNANRAFSLLLAASLLFSGGAFQLNVSACSSRSCGQDCCCSAFKTTREAAAGCCSRKHTQSRSCCHKSAEKPEKATCCKASQQQGKSCQCQCGQQTPTPIRPKRDDTTRRHIEQLLVQQLSGISLDIPSADDGSDFCDVSENLKADSTPCVQNFLCVWLT